ncbi:MAG TPA: zinc ribbon domain-containing protein [Candidatus Sulfopaludibacter sp.]|nr:zinc ribbon domain-containing protein [Candidatus Sulfopaludibacter sp.]
MIRINGKPIWFWALAFLCFAGILFCAWEAYKSGIHSIFWILAAGVFGIGIKLLLSFSQGSKTCPNCNKDIASCPAVFCHSCGQPLKDARCEVCGVDWHFVASLGRPSEIAGNSLPIIYCPNCGTFLNTGRYRENSEPWYLRRKSTARDLIE